MNWSRLLVGAAAGAALILPAVAGAAAAHANPGVCLVGPLGGSACFGDPEWRNSNPATGWGTPGTIGSTWCPGNSPGRWADGPDGTSCW